MQYGPAPLFPRAYELPGGPPSDDAMLVTCAYLVDESSPWVLQSLFLAAIGEARDRGAASIEAFAYRYPEGESPYERFHVHKTVFPADFLGDFGFRSSARPGGSAWRGLELGGLQPVLEGPPREGAARGQRGVPAGAAAGAAALGRPLAFTPDNASDCPPWPSTRGGSTPPVRVTRVGSKRAPGAAQPARSETTRMEI